MSLLNTVEPGLPPSVVCTVLGIECITVDSASSISSLALVRFFGGFPCTFSGPQPLTLSYVLNLGITLFPTKGVLIEGLCTVSNLRYGLKSSFTESCSCLFGYVQSQRRHLMQDPLFPRGMVCQVEY